MSNKKYQQNHKILNLASRVRKVKSFIERAFTRLFMPDKFNSRL